MSENLKVLIAASEVVPFAKTGGLADVVGALPKELLKKGHDVRVVMPRYYLVDKLKYDLKFKDSICTHVGSLGEIWCGVYEGKIPDTDVKVYFIEHEQFFGRAGIYNDESGNGFMDNDNRFVFFSKACLELCKMLDFRPDVINVNDWQTSAIPIFLNTSYKWDEFFSKTASVLTIHNMQHQGDFYEGLMDVLGIGWEHFNFLELEKDNQVNLLKGAIYHSTLINTVSEGYAREIQTSEYGWGLEGVVRDRASDLYGIVNGVDYDEWNPETDKYIKAKFSQKDISGKYECKKELQKAFNLPLDPEIPIVGIVSRLVNQKGIDILAESIYKLLDYDLQIVLLGSGEPWSHFYFGDANLHLPNKIGTYFGYNNELAHKIEAGSDFFLMPSRFEPCGLNQMYSLRYGTLPIVRATGGLNDTVENFNEATGEGDGFKFYDMTADAIVDTVGWAMYTYYNRPEAMAKLIKQAMKKRFTWKDSVAKYEEIYYRAVEKKIGSYNFSKTYGNVKRKQSLYSVGF